MFKVGDVVKVINKNMLSFKYGDVVKVTLIDTYQGEQIIGCICYYPENPHVASGALANWYSRDFELAKKLPKNFKDEWQGNNCV